MNMYIPRPILVEARTHDGSEKGAASLADWINDHGQEYDAQVVEQTLDGNTGLYIIEFVTEFGPEYVEVGNYIVFQNGNFDLYTKEEFVEIYQKVGE